MNHAAHRASLSRRRLLTGAAAVGLGGASLGTLVTRASAGRPAAAGDGFATAVAQWREALVGQDVTPRSAELAAGLATVGRAARSCQEAMQRGSGRATLWADAPFASSHSPAHLTRTAQRLSRMALGWATPGTVTHRDGRLLADTVDGITWLVSHLDPIAGSDGGGNLWLDWQIHIPTSMNDALVLVSNHVSQPTMAGYLAAAARWVPSVPVTGTKGAAANRIAIANAAIGRAILARDEAALRSALGALQGILLYRHGPPGPRANLVESDGFYRDGSFIQHADIPYTGGYGNMLLGPLAQVLRRVTGTPWQPDTSILAAWVRDSFAPVMWRGLVMDMVRGRNVASVESDLDQGREISAALLSMAAAVGGKDGREVAGLVKAMLLQDGMRVPASWSVPEITAGQALLADSAVPALAPPATTHVFGVMDRVVHRTADWAVGIAMNSPRISNYESGDGSNLAGWYTADGMMYLYTDDTLHYGDGYWCTVDPTRLPGTTVDMRSRQRATVGWANEYHNPEDWVGGVSLDGHTAGVGMALKAEGSPLKCRKSWFCLPDQVVVLNAAITAPGAQRVVTTIENRRLHDATARAQFTVDGTPQLADNGEATLRGVRWAHVEGTGGYVFHQPVTLSARRETRSGRLKDINHKTDVTHGKLYRNQFLTMWLEHGPSPAHENFAYSVLPGRAAAETATAAARAGGVCILANSVHQQAVAQESSGLLAVNFFRPGTIDGIRTTNPCALVIRRHAQGAQLALSDPTQKQDFVEIELTGRWNGTVTGQEGVHVTNVSNGVRIRVDTKGRAGAGRTITLRP